MKYGLTVKEMQLARKLLSNGEISFNQLMKGLSIVYSINKKSYYYGKIQNRVLLNGVFGK